MRTSRAVALLPLLLAALTGCSTGPPDAAAQPDLAATSASPAPSASPFLDCPSVPEAEAMEYEEMNAIPPECEGHPVRIVDETALDGRPDVDGDTVPTTVTAFPSAPWTREGELVADDPADWSGFTWPGGRLVVRLTATTGDSDVALLREDGEPVHWSAHGGLVEVLDTDVPPGRYLLCVATASGSDVGGRYRLEVGGP